MSAEAEVLAANAAFYNAFATGDFPGMDALWARHAPVACIHPGWPPVHGRDRVAEAWKGILRNPPRPAIRTFREHVLMFGDTATVICFEAIGDITLVATNIFVREDGGWKMVHHQAAVAEQAQREPIGGGMPQQIH